MKKILICSKNNFFKKKIKKKNFFFITKKKKLNFSYLKKLNPYIVFFPHWSYLVDKRIVKNFLCIGFHSAPLPYGRGGSPIQNMIIRGFKSTKVCAYKMNSLMDSGAIYIKRKVSLLGSGEEIFIRIYNVILKIIFKLSKKLPVPKKQTGKSTYFNRRSSEDGNLSNISNIKNIYNTIRMLDISFLNYPKAFIENKKIKFTFSDASFKKNKIIAKATILRK